MKKITILIAIIILLIIGLMIGNSLLFTGRIIEDNNFYSSTIAICNETNYCEDYKIECDGNKTLKRTATGFAIQQKENWEDPRGKQDNNLCG